MRRSTRALGLLAVAGLASVVMPAGAAPGNKYATTTTTRACDQGDTVAYTGPEKLWPPNHKMVAGSYIATEAADQDTNDDVNLETRVSSNQPINGTGDGNTDTDYDPATDMGNGTNGVATTDHNLRAERSGNDKAGRVYTVDFIATFDSGERACVSSGIPADDRPNNAEVVAPFTITVPHDQRGGAGWK